MPSQTPPTLTITLPTSPLPLSYAVYGSPSPAAPTVFYFHGFPASHHEAALLHPAALSRDIRLIAPSRPGMGLSPFDPDRSITSWPATVLALADHPAIQASTFAVLGTSGGAPYVLACCKALPSSRLRAAGIISGLYPVSLGLAGMLPEARLLLWLAPWWTGLVERMLQWGVGSAASEGVDSGQLEKVLDRGMRSRPGPDRKVWEDDEDGVREILVESVRGAFREGGAKGAAWESRLFGSWWGFDLEDVESEEGKLVLWHSEGDLNSPVAMARKAHERLRGSELRVASDEAHMSLLVHRYEEVLDVLKARAV